MEQSANVDELLRDLQGVTAFKRTQAVQQLGKLTESNKQIVEALIITKESDPYDSIREAAAAALLAPAHQAIISQHPEWAMRKAKTLSQNLQRESSKAPESSESPTLPERQVQMLTDLRQDIKQLHTELQAIKNNTNPSDQDVQITNFNMPFISLVGFLVKSSLAAIPALIILVILWLVVGAAIVSVLSTALR